MLRMGIAASIIAVAMSGCAKERTAELKPEQPQTHEPAPAELARIKVERFEVTPQTAHAGDTITARVDLNGAPPGTMLTLAWFGPNGWLAAESTAEPHGGTATFQVPASAFPDRGRYHGALRSDVVHLADNTVEFAG